MLLTVPLGQHKAYHCWFLAKHSDWRVHPHMLRAHVLCARLVLGAGIQPRHFTVPDIQEERKTENHHTVKRNDPAAPTELTLRRETRNKQNSL